MQSEVFLDASFAIALSSPTDAHHQRARELAQEIRGSSARLVTTEAVVLEIGNALARLRFREASVRLIQALQADPKVEILPLAGDLFSLAFELYRSRPDKEWGLTDCVSFIVMRDRKITEALTADDHFRQAGFRPLLDEP